MVGEEPVRLVEEQATGVADMEDKYLELFRQMPCYVTVQDRDHRILEANERFEQRFGKPNGARCWELCKQRMTPCSDCPVAHTFNSGRAESAAETVITASGDELPIMVYTAPIRGEGDQVQRVVVVASDISGMRRLQRKLYETRQRAQQLFDEAPCYITVQDRDLNIISSNRMFKEDFGDEGGHRCWEVYKHRTEPCLECPVMRTFAEGTPQSSEEVVTATSGEQRNVVVHTAPLRNAEGEITHVMEMSTNITEIRKLQSQLASLGLLIGSVSHGVKGLLTAIDGGMYLVNSGLSKDKPERIEQGWAIVQRNMRRIRSMVLDILYYAKDRELEIEQFSVLELAAEVWNLVSYRAEELGIELDRQFPTNAGTIEADRSALRTALVNLLENAFDACRVDRKKEKHRVTFSVGAGANDTVFFAVADNGIGMDRETREKMFSLFFSSKGAEGTGLGLFVSNKIVAQHGGRIEAESKPEVGTVLRLVLPRQRATDHSSPGARSES